jgi:GTP-binding protein
MVGRSNVGKSSLLNRLLRKDAARVGKTPGKTRGIYFYETDDEHELADLPGAGFARVARRERQAWGLLADELFGSGRVKLAVRLIDPRVPESPADLAIQEYLAAFGIPAIAVATKWDRLTLRERAAARRSLEAAHGPVLPVSAKTGEGVETLRREIHQRVHSHEEHPHG